MVPHWRATLRPAGIVVECLSVEVHAPGSLDEDDVIEYVHRVLEEDGRTPRDYVMTSLVRVFP